MAPVSTTVHTQTHTHKHTEVALITLWFLCDSAAAAASSGRQKATRQAPVLTVTFHFLFLFFFLHLCSTPPSSGHRVASLLLPDPHAYSLLCLLFCTQRPLRGGGVLVVNKLCRDFTVFVPPSLRLQQAKTLRNDSGFCWETKQNKTNTVHSDNREPLFSNP